MMPMQQFQNQDAVNAEDGNDNKDYVNGWSFDYS